MDQRSQGPGTKSVSESLDSLVGVLAKPYPQTRSRLGAVTRIFDAKFLLDAKGIADLHDQVGEKLRQLSPTKGSFGFLISFDDKTHVESGDLLGLERLSRNSAKATDRVVLKWIVSHPMDGGENELTLIVRISNPINPLVVLQAALSKSPEDIDNLEFQTGSVSASADGASQIFAEELFGLVARWIDSRPQPSYLTSVHEFIKKHLKKLQFANVWILPLAIAVALFYILWQEIPADLKIPVLFAFFLGHLYVRRICGEINSRLEGWVRSVRMFSLFDITGGDSNQQNRFATKAKNSLYKLVATSVLSVGLNLLSALIAIWLFGSKAL